MKNIPEDLYAAYTLCSQKKWSDESSYDKYKKIADKFLGRDASDKLEQGRLVVELTRQRIENEK